MQRWLLPALVLGLAVPAAAAPRTRCSGGRFLVADAPLVTGAEARVDAIVLDAHRVSLASACPPVRARMKSARRGMRLRAAWASCAGLTGRVRLRARIDRGCGRMAGIVKAGEVRWHFTALRVPVCGNGIREFDEACDDGNTASGDCCSASCQLEDGCAQQSCAASADCPAGFYCAQPRGDCGGEGVCRQRPEACIGVLEPVCGCDGRTYVNACEAERAGVNVRAEGRCTRGCGGIAGVSCPPGSFCELPPATCDGADLEGMCVEVPQACLQLFHPVCGCDGRTYGNDCARRAAQAQKAHDGPCACPPLLCEPGTEPHDTDGDGCPDTCLAPCHEPCDCYANPLLKFPTPCLAECATCDNFWVCEGGFCAARCGPVPPGQDQCPTPRACGVNTDCTPAELCLKPGGACDARGTCAPRPDACPALHEPVCGCDGQTYESACEAERAGVSVAARGPCPQVCGTIAGIPCPAGEFCEFPPGLCDAADLAGVCVEVPDRCPRIFSPVCGCDGMTYANDCARRAAQVQKGHDGRCECLLVTCEPGSVPRDTDGDGCVDTCVPGGCFFNGECAPGLFCGAPPGACNAEGVCVKRPEACEAIADPVCGCDGVTYANECEAGAAGARVAFRGECRCGDVCDCFRLRFQDPCPLLCAPCGNFWTCEQGKCVEHCGLLPPDTCPR